MTDFFRIRSYENYEPQAYSETGNSDLSANVDSIIRQTQASLMQETGLTAALNLWKQLNIRPETMESFKKTVGENLYQNFLAVTLELAERLYLENDDTKSLKILKAIIHEQIGSSWYKLSDESLLKRLGTSYCALHTAPLGDIGPHLFADLKDFLKWNVTDPHLNRFGPPCYWDQRPPFQIEMPDSITVAEGESATIPVTISPDVISDSLLGFYSPAQKNWPQIELSMEAGSLKVKADQIKNSHVQPEISIVIETQPIADVYVDGAVRIHKQVLVKIDNRNEPPLVSFAAPGAVTEGKKFCIEPKASDSEGDPLKYHWTIKGSHVEYEERGDGTHGICAKPPVTGKPQNPIAIELTVEDTIDTKKHPTLMSQKIVVTAQVFVTQETENTVQPVFGFDPPEITNERIVYLHIRFPDVPQNFEVDLESLIRQKPWIPFRKLVVGAATRTRGVGMVLIGPTEIIAVEEATVLLKSGELEPIKGLLGAYRLPVFMPEKMPVGTYVLSPINLGHSLCIDEHCAMGEYIATNAGTFDAPPITRLPRITILSPDKQQFKVEQILEKKELRPGDTNQWSFKAMLGNTAPHRYVTNGELKIKTDYSRPWNCHLETKPKFIDTAMEDGSAHFALPPLSPLISTDLYTLQNNPQIFADEICALYEEGMAYCFNILKQDIYVKSSQGKWNVDFIPMTTLGEQLTEISFALFFSGDFAGPARAIQNRTTARIFGISGNKMSMPIFPPPALQFLPTDDPGIYLSNYDTNKLLKPGIYDASLDGITIPSGEWRFECLKNDNVIFQISQRGRNFRYSQPDLKCPSRKLVPRGDKLEPQQVKPTESKFFNVQTEEEK